MLRQLRIFFTGIFIAFLGMLPLGTLNLAAMQIAIADGPQPAVLFAFGMLIPDAVYVLATLLAVQWIQKQKKLFRALEWMTLFIVVGLATASFYAALHPAVHKNVLLSNGFPKFWLGFVMNGINPMQIPFWFGWNTILLSKKLLRLKWEQCLVYATGVVIGTFAGTSIFIFGGRMVAEKISGHQQLVYLGVGCVFVVTAIAHIWKMQSSCPLPGEQGDSAKISPSSHQA